MIMHKKKILSISGSTRKESINLHILKAITEMYTDIADWTIFTEIYQLTHFNPGIDKETFP